MSEQTRMGSGLNLVFPCSLVRPDLELSLELSFILLRLRSRFGVTTFFLILVMNRIVLRKICFVYCTTGVNVTSSENRLLLNVEIIEDKCNIAHRGAWCS